MTIDLSFPEVKYSSECKQVRGRRNVRERQNQYFPL